MMQTFRYFASMIILPAITAVRWLDLNINNSMHLLPQETNFIIRAAHILGIKRTRNFAHRTIKLSVDTMKVAQIVFLTILVAFNVARATTVPTIFSRWSNCVGPCQSTAPNCDPGRTPVETSPNCWACCEAGSSLA
ncbi:hypothetical protein C8R48DRAFT_124639 [Suillus tomentosus]|nr:hypothetical protein C8R48DRAFT_124639 [Suillus tomentosus]